VAPGNLTLSTMEWGSVRNALTCYLFWDYKEKSRYWIVVRENSYKK